MLVCNCALPPSCCKNCHNFKRYYGEDVPPLYEPFMNQGWRCPNCGRINTPTVKNCSCHNYNETTTVTWSTT